MAQATRSGPTGADSPLAPLIHIANHPPGQLPDAEDLAQRLVGLYSAWQRAGTADLAALTAAHLHRLGIAPADPLAGLCRCTAAAVQAWHGHDYHSALHHAEVATNALTLAALADRLGQPLTPREGALLLAAALGHDLLHDGTGNGSIPFRLEACAAAALDGFADKCGAAAAERAALRALVLATDPTVRGLVGALADGDAVGRGEVPDALAALVGAPALARLAALLSDADLLSSAGLTPEWSDVQTARLAREWGRPVDAKAQAFFFERVVGPDFVSPAGRHFSGNLRQIRRACCPPVAVPALCPA